MKMKNVEDLLFTGMTYALDFEQQISKEAGKMAKAATDPMVKEMFEKSVTQGQKYAERLEQSFSKIGKKEDTNTNYIAKAMIEEVENMISNTDESPVRDAALVVAFNQQQAYRVSSYGSLASYAKLLGKQDAVQDLTQSLEEAKAGDQKLTDYAEANINTKAAQSVAA